MPLKSAAGTYEMRPSSSTVAVPWAGLLTTIGVSELPSMSVSLASTGIRTDWSSVVDAASSAACGASLTALMVTCTVALALPPWASGMLYVKLSVPLKLAAGVYDTVPSAFLNAVPCVAPPTTMIPSASASASVSFASTLMVSAASSLVVAASSTALGAWLPGLANGAPEVHEYADPAIVPSRPAPELSLAIAPDPSFKPQRPSNPGTGTGISIRRPWLICAAERA